MDWGMYSHDEWDAFQGRLMSMDELDDGLKVFYSADVQQDVEEAVQENTSGEHEDYPPPEQDVPTARQEGDGGEIELDAAKKLPQSEINGDLESISTTHNTNTTDAMEGVESSTVGHDVGHSMESHQPHLISLATDATPDDAHHTPSPEGTTSSIEPADQMPQPSSGQAVDGQMSALPKTEEVTGLVQLPEAHTVLLTDVHHGQTADYDQTEEFEDIDSDIFPGSEFMITHHDGNGVEVPNQSTHLGGSSTELQTQSAQKLDHRRDSIVQLDVPAGAVQVQPPSKEEDDSSSAPVQETSSLPAMDTTEPSGSQSAASSPLMDGLPHKVPILPPVSLETSSMPSSSPIEESLEPSPMVKKMKEEDEALAVPPASVLRPSHTTPKRAAMPDLSSSSIGKSSLLKEMRSEEFNRRTYPEKGSVPPLVLKDASNNDVAVRSDALEADEFPDIPTSIRTDTPESPVDAGLADNVLLVGEKTSGKPATKTSSDSPTEVLNQGDAAADAGSGDDVAKMDVDQKNDSEVQEIVQDLALGNADNAASSPREKASASEEEESASQTSEKAAETELARQDQQDTVAMLSASRETLAGSGDVDQGKLKRKLSDVTAESDADIAVKKARMDTPIAEAFDDSIEQHDAQVEAGELATGIIKDDEPMAIVVNNSVASIESLPSTHSPPVTKQPELLRQPKRVRKELAGLQDEWNKLRPATGSRRSRSGKSDTEPASQVMDLKKPALATYQATNGIKASKGERQGKQKVATSLDVNMPVQNEVQKPQAPSNKRKRGAARILGNASWLEQMHSTKASQTEIPVSNESHKPRKSARLADPQGEPVEAIDDAIKKKPVGGHLLGKGELAKLGITNDQPFLNDPMKGRTTRSKGQEDVNKVPVAAAAVKVSRKGRKT